MYTYRKQMQETLPVKSPLFLKLLDFKQLEKWSAFNRHRYLSDAKWNYNEVLHVPGLCTWKGRWNNDFGLL